jgi:hypothetical protein
VIIIQQIVSSDLNWAGLWEVAEFQRKQRLRTRQLPRRKEV